MRTAGETPVDWGGVVVLTLSVLVKRTMYAALGRLDITIVYGPVPVFVKSVPDTNKIGADGVYVLSVPCVNEIDIISTLDMSWSELNVNELNVPAVCLTVGPLFVSESIAIGTYPFGNMKRLL